MINKLFIGLLIAALGVVIGCEKEADDDTATPSSSGGGGEDTEETCMEPSDLGHSPFPTGRGFHWDDENNTPTQFYEVEYGVQGFTLGTGTTVNTNDEYTTDLVMEGGNIYDFYVRGYCGSEDGWSEWAGPQSYYAEEDQYLCIQPSNMFAVIIDNFFGDPVGAEISWDRNGEYLWQTTVVLDGVDVSEGQLFETDGSTVYYNLTQNTDYDFYVRAVCLDGSFTDWEGPKNVNIGD